MLVEKFQYGFYHHKAGGRTIKVRTQSGPFSRDLICRHVTGRKNLLIVEIGVFGGAHLLLLAERFKHCGHVIVGIDPWEKIDVFNGTPAKDIDPALVKARRDDFKKNRVDLERAIADYKYDIRLMHGLSTEYCAEFADESIDVLHIDGDHSEAGLTTDLESFFPKLARGGVIIGDDWGMESVRKAARAFALKQGVTVMVPDDPKLGKLSNKFLVYKR